MLNDYGMVCWLMLGVRRCGAYLSRQKKIIRFSGYLQWDVVYQDKMIEELVFRLFHSIGIIYCSIVA